MRFREGSKVEILKTDGEQNGSWFPAKVLSGYGDRYTIRYDLYLTSAGKPVVETVDEEDVRPCPPPVNCKENWAVGDIAELFDLHSWRFGKVAKVLKNDHIVARLFGSIQLKEFHVSNIRVRQAWHNNKWIMIDKACGERQFQNGHDKHSSSGYAKEFNFGTCRGIRDEKVWTFDGDKQNSIADNPSASSLKRNLSSRCSLFPGDVARGTLKKRKTNSRTNVNHQEPRKALPETLDAVSVLKSRVGEDCRNIYSKGKTIKCSQMDAVNAYTNNHAINQSSTPAQVTEEDNECSVASCSGIGFSRCTNKDNRKGAKYIASFDDAVSCSSESGNDRQSASEEEIAANVHELELHAYQSTMQALHASGPLSWEQESLLTNLRLSLNISIEEHSLHLRQLLSA